MKTLKVLQLLICSVGLAFIISACGNNSGGGSATPVTAAGTCPVSYVYSQYGCLPQGQCQAGFGSYNGQCVVATSAYGSTLPYGSTSTIPYGQSTYGAGMCQQGYVYSTRYGQCFLQSGCPMGYGNYNNYCYPI